MGNVKLVGKASRFTIRTGYHGLLSGIPDSYLIILDESAIPVEEWINDPIAVAITDQLKVAPETARDILGSVLSVRLKASKD